MSYQQVLIDFKVKLRYWVKNVFDILGLILIDWLILTTWLIKYQQWCSCGKRDRHAYKKPRPSVNSSSLLELD